MTCKHWFEGMVARSETTCPFCEIDELRAELTKAQPVAQPVQEPARYEFRWLNPGDNRNVDADELAWKLLEPRSTESMATRIAEIEFYKYNGKPIYEVRALYAASVQPVNYGEAARRRGKQVGALWQFDDLGLSLFVGEILKTGETK